MLDRLIRRGVPGMRFAASAAFAYELVALAADADWCPTLSKLSKRHDWVGPVLLVALAAHLLYPIED